LIETALAHVIGDKAEQADRRSDALENAAPSWKRGRACDPRRLANVLKMRRR
jgi:hypothetical protein